jgi:hypothetical protein
MSAKKFKAKIAEETPGSLPSAEAAILYYHQPIFYHFLRVLDGRINKALHETPINFRCEHFLPLLSSDFEYRGEEGWNLCYVYLKAIENQIERVLRKRSIFFWIHLYRRIGVELSPQHDSKTDPNTVHLVRQIVELAISKYGDRLRTRDVAPASNLHFKDILGGHFQRLWQRWVGPAEALGIFRRLVETRQWVISEFELQDFVNIYLVEGYAYEYWRVTALMRAVGKGSCFVKSGNRWPDTRESLSLTRLIISYDQRISKTRFSTALVGSWFHISSKETNQDHRMLIPVYNVERVPYSRLQTPDNETFVPNFVTAPINIWSFRNAHFFLRDAFKERAGISLDSNLLCLWALSNIALLPSRVIFAKREASNNLLDPKGPLFANFLNILQRAYTLFEHDHAGLVDEILFRAGALRASGFDYNAEDVDTCIRELILSAESQEQIALWSGGPRFPLIPFGEVFVVDLQGILSLLQTLFFRVRHDQTSRGTVFEDAFRGALAAEGFVQAQAGDIVNAPGQKREIDASVRLGEELYLFECRSIERPLDFELGRPRTLEARRRFLDLKVDQVLSLRDFITTNPSGRNYDFRWAKTISAFVVSPFVEWIWDRSDRLWHSREVPRILQADEAISFLHHRKGT